MSRDARNAALLEWYSEHQRALPWRSSSDPYPVMVSEVMLQQTQVNRVTRKYEVFMERWPTISALADAPTDDLLRVWSGLGYNSRAIRLREAARIIRRDGWPTTLSRLTELPGIGAYTASAIGSICFDLDAPAIDTNLRRVLNRWAGEPLTDRDLSEFAHASVGRPAGDWNQALMDLGSAVCTPKEPRCDICPVAEWCADPGVYAAPARQTRFEGSERQLRGALLRASLNDEDLRETGAMLGRSDAEIKDTLHRLVEEGLLPDNDRSVLRTS